MLQDSNACQSSDTNLHVLDYKKVDASSSGCSSAKNDDPVPSSSSLQQLQFRWVDDYKCSIYGIEMPPEFVHERQEHSDFHFAERLQGECTTNRLSDSLKRVISKDQISSSNRQKMRKSVAEQGKYLQISSLRRRLKICNKNVCEI